MSVIKIQPSNNLFIELGKAQLEFRTALSELIDNSIGSMVGNECNVLVQMIGDWNIT